MKDRESYFYHPWSSKLNLLQNLFCAVSEQKWIIQSEFAHISLGMYKEIGEVEVGISFILIFTINWI